MCKKHHIQETVSPFYTMPFDLSVLKTAGFMTIKFIPNRKYVGNIMHVY